MKNLTTNIFRMSIKSASLMMVFFSLQTATISKGQSLVVDTLFGNGSLSTVQIGGQSINLRKIFRQPDNKILMCGYDFDANFNANFNDMARVNECGDIDSSFGVNGKVHHTFDQRTAGYDYLLKPNGQILCCGTQASNNFGSAQFPFIAQYNSDGTVDSTFGTFGSNKISDYGSQTFANMFMMPNGKILCTMAGGYTAGPNLAAMRFLPNGTVDSTYANNGALILPYPPNASFYIGNTTSVLRADGTIISTVPTYYGNVNQQFLMVMAYDSLGVIDTTFGTNGFFVDSYAYSQPAFTLLQSTGKTISAGGAGGASIQFPHLFRLNTNGQLDSTFATNGYLDISTFPIYPGSELKALLPLGNDRFMVEYSYSNNSIPNYFVAYDSNGIPDTNFTINGGATNLQSLLGNYIIASGATLEPNDEITLGGAYLGNNSFFATRLITSTTSPFITQTINTLHSNVTNTTCTFQWYFNGTAIANATDSIYNITQNGNYTVVVTNSWGCEGSITLSIVFNGIQETNNGFDVSIYPNPVKNELTISGFQFQTGDELKIIDVVGKEIYSEKITNETINLGHIERSRSVQTSNLHVGLYFLEITSSNKKSVSKFIKSN